MEGQDEVKMVWLVKKEKKKKMKMMRKDEERMKDEQSAIMKDRSSIWASYSVLVTWVGWEMEKVVHKKLLRSSLVYNYSKCEFYFFKKNHKINV